MKYTILVPIIIIFLSGCNPVNKNQNSNDIMNWKFGDIRLLDGIDTLNPDQDLIAVYTRTNNQSFQIRLDFLELDIYLGKDIYIAIDTGPGGVTQALPVSIDLEWEYLIKISDSGDIGIFDENLSPLPGVEIFIVYDSWQDRIIISFDNDILPLYYGKTKMQVSITAAGQTVVADISEQFSLDSTSPSKVKVLFAFWNTFSSATPAETLRSWAGAHTGPARSRHGLSYLLDSASKYHSTVFLLDLLTPDTLSALDYLNVLPRIRSLANDGILALPDSSLVEILDKNVASMSIVDHLNSDLALDVYKTWKISGNFESNVGISNGDLVILMNNNMYEEYKFNNFVNNDYAQLFNKETRCALSALFSDTLQLLVDAELPLACKRLIIDQVLDKSPTPLVLGGDFYKSVMGDPSMSSEVFAYISAHPWIQIYSINDLADSKNNTISSGFVRYLDSMQKHNAIVQTLTTSEVISNKVHESLLESPRNEISDLAWKVFTYLSQTAPPELVSLRANYIGQIGMILSASNWAENPRPIAACDIDLDYDGFSECILANKNIFVVIEPDGGYIPFVFASDKNGIHQIVGPTWEYIVGLSDVTSWNIDLGVRADPGQLLGAFQDPFSHWNQYHAKLVDSGIVLETDSLTIHKTINILPDSIHIEVLSPGQSVNTTSIPLVIDPWLRYTSGWGNLYTKTSVGNNFFWGIHNGEIVEIRSTIPLNENSFNDTYSAMFRPEDPNFDYSPGHYIPFPISVVKITTSGNYLIDIIINP